MGYKEDLKKKYDAVPLKDIIKVEEQKNQNNDSNELKRLQAIEKQGKEICYIWDTQRFNEKLLNKELKKLYDLIYKP